MESFDERTTSSSSTMEKAALLIGGAIAGAWLAKIFHPQGAALPDDDCPVIIKSGSLELALGPGVTSAPDPGNPRRFTVKDSGPLNHCRLWVVSLEYGLPVAITEHAGVQSVRVQLTHDHPAHPVVDTITIAFLASSTLELTAVNDNQFGNVQVRPNHHGHAKHPKKIVHRRVNNQEEISITSVAVNGGPPQAANDAVLAFKFY